MCNPVALGVAGLALGGGSAIAQYQGQRQQAKQQERYQEKAMEAERQRALQEQSSIRMRQAQEQEATNRELGDVAMKAREAMARATTSAGESGVAGASVDALIDDFTRQEAEYRMGVGRQQEMRDVQTGLALTDAGFRSRNRLIDINRPINKPSFLSGVLGAGSAGLSGFAGGYGLGREIQLSRTPKID